MKSILQYVECNSKLLSLDKYITESTIDNQILAEVKSMLNKSHVGSFGNGLAIDSTDKLWDLCTELPKATSINNPKSTKQNELPKLPKYYVALVKTDKNTKDIYFVSPDSQYATPKRGIAMPNDAIAFSTRFVVEPTSNIYDNWQHFERAAEHIDIYKTNYDLVELVWNSYVLTQKKKTKEYKERNS